jgi:hypothetical protein
VAHQDIAMSNPPPRKPKAVLLGEQTARTYFANIAHVYRHHFGVIVSCSGLPYVLPATILTLALINLNPEQPQPALIAAVFVGLGLGYLGLFLTAAVLSVVLSDICLGNVPTVKRAFAHVFGKRRLWYVFTTSLLAGMAMLLGLILLVIPGLWVLIRSLFAVPVVILEGRRNRDAIRRSFALTRGQAWRITGLYLLALLVGFLIGILVGVPFGIATGIATVVAGPQSTLARFLPLLAQVSSFILSLPASMMTVILLYYDQRVRRESYDAQALSEDLMR